MKINSMIKLIYKYDKLYIAKSILIIMLSAMLTFMSIYIIEFVFNYYFVTNNIISTLVVIAVAYFCIFIVSILMTIIKGQLSISTQKISTELNIELYENIYSTSYETAEQASFQDEVSIKQDVTNDFITSTIMPYLMSIMAVINITVASVVLLKTEYAVILISIEVFLLIILIYSEVKGAKLFIEYIKFSRPLFRKIGVYSWVTLDNAYIKDLKLNGYSQKLSQIYEKELNSYIVSDNIQAHKIAKKKFYMSQTVITLQNLIFFVFIVILLSSGVIKDVEFTTIFLAITAFILNINSIADIFSEKKMSSEFEKIIYGNSKDKPSCLNKEKESHSKIANVDLTTIKIIFENVYYKYANSDKFILENISFEINNLQKIAIVGRNGSGKTTIIKLILGIYKPTRGRILINNIDITDLNQECLSKIYSFALQNSKINPFSLRDNIMSNNNCEERFLRNLSKLNLSKINDLNAYMTRNIKENGIQLSGGEEKRIVIARTMSRESSTYIFDEPTSNLDPINEEAVINLTLKELNKNVIWVVHRLKICANFDKIVLIDGGTIAEEGSFEELYNAKKLFRELYDFQVL